MSTRWPGGIISGTAPVPTGGGAQDTAPGVWTLEQADQYIATQEWPGTGIPDPQFQYVTALLHGDGTNAGQNNTFIDSSSNNLPIFKNGNTTQGSFSPYGNLWSNFQPNIASDFLSFATGSGTSFQFPGDFTIEAWVLFPTSTNTDHSLYVSSPNNNDYFALNIAMDTGLYNLYLNSTGISSSISSGIPVGQWTHVAMVRSGSTITMYTNGSPRGTVSNSSTLGYASPILNRNGGGGPSSGQRYVSNLRIVKGTAVYTSAFTPSTTPLTAISGTSVLICQSNRFVDNSSNNFAITVGGTPSVQRFAPFQNLATYTTARVGGSGYFDGSGDFLSVPANAAWNLANNSFTIECWSYPTAAQSDKHLFSLNDSGGTGFWVLRYNTGTTPQFIYNNYSLSLTSSTAAIINQWNHIAVSSNGSTISLYLNGVRVATSSSTTITNGSANPLIIGSQLNVDRAITGYVSDARVVNGSAIYNPSQSTLTVPTAPLTNVTNTSLLTNFTNAAIFDSDASSVLETAGNAQISTSVVKYGTGSMYFDGTGDWLNTAPTIDLEFGSGNFTIECWLYALTTNRLAIYHGSSGTDWSIGIDIQNVSAGLQRACIWASSNGTSWNLINADGGGNGIGRIPFPINTWVHFAYVRSGTTWQTYVNGQLDINLTGISGSIVNRATSQKSIGKWFFANGSGSPGPWNGYIDDFRVTKGYARYWYNFQPPTRAFPNYGGTLPAPINDELFAYNTLLLNGDGANGGQNNTFLDSSTNNFTITRNGNTTQGSFSPYGTLWSNYFDGNSTLTTSSSTFAWGTGDFTIECWLNNSVAFVSGGTNVLGTMASGGGLFFGNTSVGIAWNVFGVGNVVTYNTQLPLGSWNHIAYSRQSGTGRLFVNGALVGSGSDSNNYTATSFNAGGTGGQYYTGYISNLRVVNSAIYISTFTPSTTPLTAIANTSLLTCQSNRFRDASSNNFTLTVNGSPLVQRFSPFEPSAPYSTSVIGGSGYFDGSGDSISVTNAALNPSGQDLTVSFWMYVVSYPSTFNMIFEVGTASVNDVQCPVLNTGELRFQVGGVLGSQISGVKLNNWHYVTCVKSGNNFTVYLDNVAGNTVSLTASSQTQLRIGTDGNGGSPFNGYISNFRYIRGSAIVPTSIPTAPLTPITNTQFLANFTNAAIPDYAMQNNLETVGNAQISTSVVKYGTGSLAFDGNGDYLFINNQIGFPTNAPFTIECWVYLNNNTNGTIFAKGGGSGSWSTSNGHQFLLFIESGNFYWMWNNAGSNTQITVTPPATGIWTHIAVTYDGTTTRLFFNGNIMGTSTTGYTLPTTRNRILLGINPDLSALPLNGYIDDLRFTQGIARYVQPFTPPTAALPTF